MSTIKLQQELEAAYLEFKTANDGGLAGALVCANALLDHFTGRRPDWIQRGLLNPLLEILDTLKALDRGGTSRILYCNDDKIDHLRMSNKRSELYYRGIVSALIDEMVSRCNFSLDQASGFVARRLRSRSLPVGRNDSDDVTTLKNWRKRASVGQTKRTIDGEIYAKARSQFQTIDGSPDLIVETALETVIGIFPPGDRKLK
jgi:hypothetical protein